MLEKGNLTRFLFCHSEEQVVLPGPVYLLCPSLPGELFDADLKVAVSLSTPCSPLLVFTLKLAPSFCNNPQGAGCCASCASMKDLHSTPFPSHHTSQCDSCVFQPHSLRSPDFSRALVGGQKGYQTYRDLPWDLQK